jgi:hypothetical protein
MSPYETSLTRLLLCRTKGERKKYLEEVMKDRDACSAKALELGKDQDLWKGRCNQMVTNIKPVLDLIDLELSTPAAGG